jgi:hypothetical protein
MKINLKFLKFSLKFKSLVLLAFMALPLTSSGQVALITAEEAQRPDSPLKLTRGITRGPSIKLLSNATVDAKSFAFNLMIEPRGGSKIIPASLKVEYLKEPVIDLTDRFKSAFNGAQIEITKASVPIGLHALKVSIKDTDGRDASTVISLEAK